MNVLRSPWTWWSFARSSWGLLALTFCATALPAQVRVAPGRVSDSATGPMARRSSSAKAYPKCTYPHRGGRDNRAKRLLTAGDTKVLSDIAEHVTLYARDRYGLHDVVTDKDLERARHELDGFMRWKVGSPSLVGAQWVTAGTQHFDHHADEAAAALLGMELPGPGAQVRLPKELSDWLKQKVDSLAKSDSSVANICAGMGDSTFVGFACDALVPIVLEALASAVDRTLDRIGISSAALLGKNKYDITDAEIELLAYVRRNPVLSVRLSKPLRSSTR